MTIRRSVTRRTVIRRPVVQQTVEREIVETAPAFDDDTVIITKRTTVPKDTIVIREEEVL